nr:macrophage mannose receptor 1-like [Penaeus vannamei]
MWQLMIAISLLGNLSRVRASCTYPYVTVGEKCLFFATMAEVPHSEARQMCHSMDGELAALLTPTQFKDFVDYIKDNGFSGHRFWLDGSDAAAEGLWQTSAGHPLPMGTPFWATFYGNSEPNNKGNEDCLEVFPTYFNYMNDVSCDTIRTPVCEKSVASASRNATAPKDCPMPYVELAGLCLAFVTWADQGWAEARQTCHGLSGELAAITDIEQLRAVYLYLHQESIAGHSFWLGGSDGEEEGSWTWTGGAAVDMGTPFWGFIGSAEGQEPKGGAAENCLCLDARAGHFFFDARCGASLNPLCMLVQQ